MELVEFLRGQAMLTKTNVMFFLGAWMTALAVRLFAYPFIGPYAADRLALTTGFLFAIFAFNTMKNALIISAIALLWGASYFYFFDFRRDAVGFAVMVTCGALCYLILRPLKRARDLQRG
jgi:hypothetical protein